jgi:hypothetical protein
VASVPITKAVRMLLSAWYQHVVAGAVGAEHVVVAHQAHHGAADQAHHGHRQQGGTQRQVGTIGRDVAQRRTEAAMRAAHQRAGGQSDQRGHEQAAGCAGQGTLRHVARPLALRVGEVRACRASAAESRA